MAKPTFDSFGPWLFDELTDEEQVFTGSTFAAGGPSPEKLLWSPDPISLAPSIDEVEVEEPGLPGALWFETPMAEA